MSLNIPGFLAALNHLSPIKWSFGNLAPCSLLAQHFPCNGLPETTRRGLSHQHRRASLAALQPGQGRRYEPSEARDLYRDLPVHCISSTYGQEAALKSQGRVWSRNDGWYIALLDGMELTTMHGLGVL
jgi:hypothetical protein